MELLRELIRAAALEDLLARAVTDAGTSAVPPRPVSPGVPAARALHRAPNGTGDVFSMRVGSPAAALAMGLDPREILRQALARDTAPARGRDAGGFPTDLDRGLLGPVHPPGTLVEVLAGMALAFRLREEARVALVVDDLAGTASGDWHEGLNLAAVQEVPLVVVLDHAGRGPMDAPVRESRERASAYGFGVYRVEGTDPRAVERVIWNAVEAARTGQGLQVVDVTPPAEDPLRWLWDSQVAAEVLSHHRLRELEESAEDEMRQALAEVEAEPDPDPAVALLAPDAHLSLHRRPPWAAD